jgi:hypothetical protein
MLRCEDKRTSRQEKKPVIRIEVGSCRNCKLQVQELDSATVCGRMTTLMSPRKNQVGSGEGGKGEKREEESRRKGSGKGMLTPIMKRKCKNKNWTGWRVNCNQRLTRLTRLNPPKKSYR